MNSYRKRVKISSELNDSKSKPTPIAMVAPELKQNAEANTEITKTCAVLGCEDYKKLDPTYSFFRFPEESSLKQVWVDLTGRNNWTPTDYSYICIQHFSVDCFEADDEGIALSEKAVPSIKLPRHVLEVEYIDENSFDNEIHEEPADEMDSDYTEFEDEEMMDAEITENGEYTAESEIQDTSNTEDKYENFDIKKATSLQIDQAPVKFIEKQVMQKPVFKMQRPSERLSTISRPLLKGIPVPEQSPKFIHKPQRVDKGTQISDKVVQKMVLPETVKQSQQTFENFLRKQQLELKVERPQLPIKIEKPKLPLKIEKPKMLVKVETPKMPEIVVQKPVAKFMLQSQEMFVQKQTKKQIEKPAEDEQFSKDKIELLQLFTEVQRMQRQAVTLKDKLKLNMKMHNRQNRHLDKVNKLIEIKKKALNQKRKKKSRILLSIQDKIKEDKNGLALAMPMKQTEDLKNFSLSIYKYSPQAYIYIRNMLRTLLPGTDTLEMWLNAGHQPRNVLMSNNMIKVTAEQSEKELSCKVSLG